MNGQSPFATEMLSVVDLKEMKEEKKEERKKGHEGSACKGWWAGGKGGVKGGKMHFLLFSTLQIFIKFFLLHCLARIQVVGVCSISSPTAINLAMSSWGLYTKPRGINVQCPVQAE